MTTFTLKSMKARVRRLEEFAREMAAELEVVKDAEQSVLLPAVTDVIAAAEAARVVMAKAVRRLERWELSDDVADDAA